MPKRGRPPGTFGVKPARVRTDAVARALRRAFPTIFELPPLSALQTSDLANAIAANVAQIEWPAKREYRVVGYSSIATRENAVRCTQKRLTGRHANRHHPLPADQVAAIGAFEELIVGFLSASSKSLAGRWKRDLHRRGWPQHILDRLEALATNMGARRGILGGGISFPVCGSLIDAMVRATRLDRLEMNRSNFPFIYFGPGVGNSLATEARGGALLPLAARPFPRELIDLNASMAEAFGPLGAALAAMSPIMKAHRTTREAEHITPFTEKVK